MASIVVVDDDEDIANLIAVHLSRVGHGVTTVHTGTEGFEAIRDSCPDLAIVDWMMPGIDGFQLAEQVRSNSALARTKLLLLTARSSAADVKRAVEAGFDGVIHKPFRAPELHSAVDRLL